MRAESKQLLTGALVILLLLCGCRVGQAEDPHEQSASTTTKTQSTAGAEYGLYTLGRLSVGLNSGSLPYTGTSDAGVTGLEPALLRTISYRLGLEMDLADEPDPTVSLENRLLAGEFDVILSPYPLPANITDQVAVTDPYYTYEAVLGVRENSSYQSADELIGRKMVGDRYALRNLWPNNEWKNAMACSGNESIERLMKMKAEGILLERHVADRYRDVCEGRIRWIDWKSQPQSFVMVVRKDNTRLLAVLNAEIRELQEDGTMDRYLTECIP